MNQIENIDSFHKNNEKLSTAGQPTEAEFNLIADNGFNVVINIRPDSEMVDLFDEKSIVEELGLKYFQIPVTLDTLNKEILSQFFELMDKQKENKVFLHCRKNVRVPIILSLYQVVKLGRGKDEALQELRELVEVNPMLENFIDFHISNYSDQN